MGTAADLRTSIVLCTYNGERFLEEQLASIAAQTHLADELVVCDDGSIDRTLAIVRAFAHASPFAVQVHEGGAAPLGPAANFERGLRLASGDVLVLCDQDDVWYRDRIERTVAAFSTRPTVLGTFSDADLIDDEGRPDNTTLWHELGIAGRLHARYDRGDAATKVGLLCVGNIVTGATLAVRANTLDVLLPIPEGWMHDHWFAVVLSALDGLVALDAPVCRYRIHADQHIGVAVPRRRWSWHARRHLQVRRRLRKDVRAPLQDLALTLDSAVERVRAAGATANVVELLEARRDHFVARAGMASGGPRLRVIARELATGRYHRHSTGLSSALKDLALTDARNARAGTRA